MRKIGDRGKEAPGTWKDRERVKRFRGRPKKSIEEHTGKSIEQLVAEGVLIDEPSYKECAELLRQVYEECGPAKAIYLVERFECERLRDIMPKYFADFVRKAKALLQEKRSSP